MTLPSVLPDVVVSTVKSLAKRTADLNWTSSPLVKISPPVVIPLPAVRVTTPSALMSPPEPMSMRWPAFSVTAPPLPVVIEAAATAMLPKVVTPSPKLRPLMAL